MATFGRFDSCAEHYE